MHKIGDIEMFTDLRGREIIREYVGEEEIRGLTVPVYRYITKKQAEKEQAKKDREAIFTQQNETLPGWKGCCLYD